MARRNTNPVYVGLDFSLTSPGIAIQKSGIYGDGLSVDCLKPPPKKSPQYEPVRLATIADHVIEHIEEKIPLYKNRGVYIFIEDYAYGGMGKTFAIAECMGIIKYNLLNLSIPHSHIFLVSIPHMKMFCCGKGTASKDTIIKEVYKRWGYDTNNNNKADAFVLMQIAKNYFEPNDLTAFQIEALKRIRLYNEPRATNKKKKSKKV